MKNTEKSTFSNYAPIALILVSFFWGSTFPWVKKAMADFSPVYWVAFRFMLASFLFGLAYIFSRGSKLAGIKEGLILGSVLGSAFILQTIGIKLSSAATMGLLTGLILPFIFVLETFIGGKILSPKLKICLLLAFAGVLMLSWEGGLSFHLSDILGVIASLLFALQIFLTGKFAPKYKISNLNFYQMSVVCILAFFFAFIFEDFTTLNFSSSIAISSILFTAVICSFFAFFTQTWAQRFVSPSKTTLLFSLEPLFAAIISWMIYYTDITLIKVIGALLLLSAVAIVQIKKKSTTV